MMQGPTSRTSVCCGAAARPAHATIDKRYGGPRSAVGSICVRLARCDAADPAVTNHSNGTREILYSPTPDGAASTFTAEHAVINRRYFDVAFTGAPLQCDENDGTCAAIKQTYRWDKSMGAAIANQYRYVMDVDGNGEVDAQVVSLTRFRLVRSLPSSPQQSFGGPQEHQLRRVLDRSHPALACVRISDAELIPSPLHTHRDRL